MMRTVVKRRFTKDSLIPDPHKILALRMIEGPKIVRCRWCRALGARNTIYAIYAVNENASPMPSF